MKQKMFLPLIMLCMFFSAITTTAPVQSQDVATYMLSLINNLRSGLGLHSYTLNGALTAAAQNQASWMAITGQISHTQPDGSTPRTRAQAAGYASTWVSENIYMGRSATSDSAFQWWINSPIHYRGLTNLNYTEIGIAMSDGPAGRAYVLVFGNPDNTVRVAPPITTNTSDPYGYANANNQQGTGTTGNAVANAAPAYVARPYIVGLDNLGNIMHEIQPGDTLGDIALIYGYGWDDLERIRQLNAMTESEGRWLDVGAILLIPPYDGTYTPTPSTPSATPTDSPSNTPGPSPTPSITPTPTETYTPSPTLTPSITPTPTETLTLTPTPTLPEGVRPLAMSVTTPTLPPAPTVIVAEAVIVTEEVILPPPPSFSAEITPSPTPLVVAQNNGDVGGLISPVSTAPQTITPPAPESDNRVVPLLLIAVGLQVVIIGIAGLEFMSRRRRKN
jgi:hypothetical protein